MALNKTWFGLLLLTGCALPGESQQDPFEPFNRSMLTLNTTLDETVFAPFYGFYNDLPDPVRQGFFSFVQNLSTPIYVLNALWNGEFIVALRQLSRFVINTLWGIGGVMDVARDSFDLNHEPQDFGRTFQAMGIGSGPFMILPVLGPCTLRDLAAGFAETTLNPGRMISMSSRQYAWMKFVSLKLSYQQSQSDLSASFQDQYPFVRDFYLQMSNRLSDQHRDKEMVSKEKDGERDKKSDKEKDKKEDKR